MNRPGIALLDFGGPRGPDELQPFLRNLLADVLPGPAPLRRAAATWIARARSRRVGPAYEEIGWSPLVPTHLAQADAVRAALGEEAPPLASGMMYTPPTMDSCVRELLDAGVDTVVALSLFPQYSLATTQSAFTMFHEALERAGAGDLPVHWIGACFDHPAYVEAVSTTIRETCVGLEGEVHLVFSPHGLPVSFVRRGDPYPDQIRESARRIIAELDWDGPWHLGWQSRVGPVRWLSPSTPEVIVRLGAAGVKQVLVVPVAFVAEHIETLHELDIELAAIAAEAGITTFRRAPALGLQPAWIRCLTSLIQGALKRARYHCVRCLHPRPDAHRRRPSCPNCGFQTPAFLRGSRTWR